MTSMLTDMEYRQVFIPIMSIIIRSGLTKRYKTILLMISMSLEKSSMFMKEIMTRDRVDKMQRILYGLKMIN